MQVSGARNTGRENRAGGDKGGMNSTVRSRTARRARPVLRPRADYSGREILRPTPATFGYSNGGEGKKPGPSMARVIVRLEGAAALGIGVLLYERTGESWWLFAALFLAPDVSMLGYVVGDRFGAFLYNLFHTYVGPAALAAYGLAGEHIFGEFALAVPLSLVWLSHIGIDRLLGFGLKYATGFRDHHLHRV
jgi:hypothetical protein